MLVCVEPRRERLFKERERKREKERKKERERERRELFLFIYIQRGSSCTGLSGYERVSPPWPAGVLTYYSASFKSF